MDVSITIVDEKGEFHELVLDVNLLSKLEEKLRTEGITTLYTLDDKGQKETCNVQAAILMAKNCNGKMVFVPNE